MGPGKEAYMHTITAGLQRADCPTLVAIPGYAAGTGFFFRCVWELGKRVAV